MRWHDLLFAHWPVAAELLRPLAPPALEIDLFAGAAWVGVVPFRMSGVAPRGGVDLPRLSAFPELNVRTYVTVGGKPGVWFFSLDAANPLAVAVARRWFHLPYFRARMAMREEGGWIVYESARAHPGFPGGAFRGRYRPVGEVAPAAGGSLDAWLTERYCLYAADRAGRLYRGEIHHAPWPLQPAEAEIAVNTVAEAHGVVLAGPPALLHFARRLDVVAWAPHRAPLEGRGDR